MKESAPAPAAAATPADAPRPGLRTHPNELDQRRIARLLEKRMRYRYVSPRVEACDDGYRVVSPCCSRNVDQAGGDIDIARLAWDADSGAWRLYSKDHARGEWLFYDSGRQIDAVLMALLVDAYRVFWP
ncbi:DUF3024 domain-containing protein [Aromatoleum toluvorans]|nr:DUF3024 domain-containing protein [Aromatoleum toluvorans]